MTMRPNSTTTPERLLTIPEAAQFLQVSTKTIRRWIAAGNLAAARLGQQWRIRPQDLNRFVRDHLEG